MNTTTTIGMDLGNKNTLIPDFEKGEQNCAGNPLHDLKPE